MLGVGWCGWVVLGGGARTPQVLEAPLGRPGIHALSPGMPISLHFVYRIDKMPIGTPSRYDR